VAAFEGLKKFKMAAIAMVTKVQKNVKFSPNSGSLQSLSNRFRFFSAYLVPLDVDVFPVKFHQFLFGE
jgi:hypothetical protein